MKRMSIMLGAIIALAVNAAGQSYEGTIEYDKKKQQALVIDYSYTQEAVENALVQKIEKLGYSSKTEKGLFNKNKGFIVFSNTVISEIDPVQHDYLLKIEKAGRKSSGETTLYMVIMSNGQNALSAMRADEVGKAKLFLNNLLPEIEEAKLELDIRGNEETIVKAEKEFKKLQDEKADLEKKIKKNQEDLEKQTKQIENFRISLDALKAKRKGAAAPVK